ncbi:MAG: heavy metal translocating P-type ATPase [Thermoanaerobaculia bacterium]|nr:heavy metal translocating P-type ATPase [Thermoanaerobaculia bacterium]
MSTCFHCGLPQPAGATWSFVLDGEARPLCCAGCEAVARAIVASGGGDYYRLRTELPPQGRELVPDFLGQLAVYDHPAVQRTMVRDSGDLKEAALLLEDLSCAACVWLAERSVGGLAGVREFSINYATRRALVRWDPATASLSRVLQAIAAIGFTAHPYDRERAQEVLARERRDRLLRFLVAGALGMQVMTLAVALYAGAFSGMEEPFRKFFRWTSLLLTAPVLLYSARPFFAGAFKDLSHARVGMDVPVALGLTLAYFGSVWATLADRGEVYFDSVVMFVFLLLGARVLELVARERAVREQESVVRSVPATARRLAPEAAGGGETIVATVELAVGDRVRILPGESVPADGVIEDGLSSLDEALLTGESVPVARAAGERVIGGAVNVESPLVVRVTAVGEGTVLQALLGLVEQALAAKPEISRVADRTAQWFVRRILVLAAGVGLYWAWADPERVLPTVIAVLVVSCPCALSLATPVALAAASGALARRGLLATRGHAIETLGRADLFVFDKTGTLTTGKLRVDEVVPQAPWSAAEILGIAAALERGSEHPIAGAIASASAVANGGVIATSLVALRDLRDLRNVPGRGLTATVEGERVALGSPGFVADQLGLALPPEIAALAARERTMVVLAGESGVRGAILLDDSLRPESPALVAELRRAGKRVLLLSGDEPGAVRRIAAAAGIDEWEGGASPERKVERVRELTASGAVVAMVGDGVNDAAALAAAPVSVAMGSGAFLAAATADAVLLSNRPQDLGFAVRHAALAIRRVKQNFALAFGYNLIVIPLAAMGRIPPWAAAIGMSASSAMVVLNALRLRSTADDAGSRRAA